MENSDSFTSHPEPTIIANNLRVENLLGRGGMGTVYRATHLSLDRVVAVKIINPEFVANTDVTQRFTREAKLMAKLRHPRAAMIYDAGNLPDGRLYIVMEYVEGTTLADVIKKEEKLPFRRAVEIAASICDVLSEAHAVGIIHRDLKPANIMLNEQGVFVLDFGIAKMLRTDNAESLRLSMTGTGLLVGTPFYMSPEQCMGEPVDARSDLYSLGALLYEMLAGRPPFNDEVLSAIIIKHAMVEAPSVLEFREDVPPALAAVVQKLLSKKPDDRPASASAARILLEASINDQPADFVTKSGTQPNLTTRSTPGQVSMTQQLGNSTSTQIPKPTDKIQPLVSTTGNARKWGMIAGFTALFLLAAGGSLGGFLWMRTHPDSNVTSNNPSSNSMSNMNHNNGMGNMDPNMPMGDDFAKNTQPEDNKTATIPLLSTEEADKVITEITRTTSHHADGMQIVKTPKDSALVCLHNKIAEGQTHMFAVERPNINSPWEITARTSLDTPEFHGASWIFEPEDVDGDGYEEVIYKGVSANQKSHRIVIYVPRTRQTYSILSVTDAKGKTTNTLSPNALATNGAPFRKALEQIIQNN